MSDAIINKMVRMLTEKLMKAILDRMVPILARAVADELEKRNAATEVELVPVEEVARIVGEKMQLKNPLDWVNHHTEIFDRQRVGKRYLYNKNTIDVSLMRVRGM